MDLDADCRRILSLARDARTPTLQDKARIERRMAVAIGLSAAAVTTAGAASATAASATAASSGAAKAAGSALALKWALGGCALLAAAVASYAALSSSEPAPPRAHVARPAVIPVPSPSADAVPHGLPAPALAPAPARAHAHAHTRARAAAGGALSTELVLLHAAQAAWRAGDPERALTLSAQHRRRYPRSALGLERDALRVLALCDLKRSEEAERLGRAWLARAPSSPLRTSIERSCAMQ